VVLDNMFDMKDAQSEVILLLKPISKGVGYGCFAPVVSAATMRPEEDVGASVEDEEGDEEEAEVEDDFFVDVELTFEDKDEDEELTSVSTRFLRSPAPRS